MAVQDTNAFALPNTNMLPAVKLPLKALNALAAVPLPVTVTTYGGPVNALPNTTHVPVAVPVLTLPPWTSIPTILGLPTTAVANIGWTMFPEAALIVK